MYNTYSLWASRCGLKDSCYVALMNVDCFIGSQNSTVERERTEISTALQISLTAVYSVTFITALLGNVLLIHIIRQRRPISAVSILIINMAVSDLLAALFTMPYSVAFFYVQSRWFGGIAGVICCKLVHFIIGTTIGSSIFALQTISVERYIAVVKPILYPSIVKRPVLLSSTIWLSSVLYMSVFLYIFDTETDINGVSYCFPNWEPLSDNKQSPQIFYSSIAILLYILPLSVIAVLSVLIIKKLKSQKVPANGFQPADHVPNFQNRNYRVMRMLLAIVVIFAVCWLPVHVMHFLINFHGEIYDALPPLVRFLLFWISHANSAFNPCIVILLNGSFRASFMVMVRRLHCNLCFKSNRVNCVNVGHTLPSFTRKRGWFSFDLSVRWSKQDGHSPITLLDIRRIPVASELP